MALGKLRSLQLQGEATASLLCLLCVAQGIADDSLELLGCGARAPTPMYLQNSEVLLLGSVAVQEMIHPQHGGPASNRN
jgi:hypothetical protein